MGSLTSSLPPSSLPPKAVELAPLPSTHSRASLLAGPPESTERVAQPILQKPVVNDVAEGPSLSQKGRKWSILGKTFAVMLGLGAYVGGVFYNSIGLGCPAAPSSLIVFPYLSSSGSNGNSSAELNPSLSALAFNSTNFDNSTALASSTASDP